MKSEEPKFFPVFRKECTSCSHLVKHARTALVDCHFTKGNTRCPAKTNYIGVGVNIEKASAALARTIIDGDAVALADAALKLKKYEPEETTAVLEAVRLLILGSFGITRNDDGEFIMEEDDEESDDSEDESESEEEADGDESEAEAESEDDGTGSDEEEESDEEDEDGSAFDTEVLTALIDSRVQAQLVEYGLIKLIDKDGGGDEGSLDIDSDGEEEPTGDGVEGSDEEASDSEAEVESPPGGDGDSEDDWQETTK